MIIRFMLRFKMGIVSNLSLKSLDIQRPGGIMCDHLFKYVIEILLLDNSNSTTRFIIWFKNLKWPLYSGFLIGECTFSTISSGKSWIFNFFKHMSLRYFFQTILGVVQYVSYNLKLSPYALVVCVQKYYNVYSFTRSKNLNFFQN